LRNGTQKDIFKEKKNLKVWKKAWVNLVILLWFKIMGELILFVLEFSTSVFLSVRLKIYQKNLSIIKYDFLSS